MPLPRRPRRSSPRTIAHPSMFEALEPRVVLAAVSWDGGGGNSLWSNRFNWSGDVRPNQNDDVTINVLGVQRTIIADAGPIKVKSLTVDETLVINSGINLSVVENFNLTQGAQLRINGLVNWSMGTWDSDAAARVNPGGLLNVGSLINPAAGTFNLQTNLDNFGRTAFRGGKVLIQDDDTITNHPGKAMDIARTWFDAPTNQAKGDLVNHGLLRKGGVNNEMLALRVAFTNNDRFFILRGEVNLQSAGTSLTTAPFINRGRVALLDPTSKLTIEVHSTHDGASYTGPGTMSVAAPKFFGQPMVINGNVNFGASSTVFTFGTTDAQFGPDPTTIRGSMTLPENHDFTSTWNLTSDLTIAGTISAEQLDFGGTGGLTISGTLRLVDINRFDRPSLVTTTGSLEVGRSNKTGGIWASQPMTVNGTLRLVQGGVRRGADIDVEIGAAGRVLAEGPATLGGSGFTFLDFQAPGKTINFGLMHANGASLQVANLDNRGVAMATGARLTVSDSPQLVPVAGYSNSMLTGGSWVANAEGQIEFQFGTIDVIGAEAAVEILTSDARVFALENSLTEVRGRLTLGSVGTYSTNPVGGSLIVKGRLQKVASGIATLSMPVVMQKVGNAVPTIDVQSGVLALPGNLSNLGLVTLGAAGRLEVADTFTNQTAGIVTSNHTSTNFGRIIAGGAMSILGGQLRAVFSGGGFTPGLVRTVINASDRTGTFTTFTPTGLAAPRTAELQYGSSSVGVRVL